MHVLAPFCGTGTTVVECKKLGIASVGVEANPMAWFATRVKTDWQPDPDELELHAKKLSQEANAVLERDGITEYDNMPLFRRTTRCSKVSLRRIRISNGLFSHRLMYRPISTGEGMMY